MCNRRPRTINPFFGFGASAIVAQDAEQKFPLFGIPCRALSDSHQQVMAAAMMGPEDVAVAISNTGLSQGIIEAALIARDKGATTIALTGARSRLSEVCKICLLVETLDNTDAFTPTTSRVAALVVIDVLSIAVALRRHGDQLDRMRDMKETLRDFRQGGLADQAERPTGVIEQSVAADSAPLPLPASAKGAASRG